MQSSLERFAGLHVAVIMDGNGRWATARRLPRTAGHRAGVDALRAVVETAPAQGIGTLTVFAFSSDNWRRPPAEVAALMSMTRRFLRGEAAGLARENVRLSVIGRRDRLPDGLARAIAAAEAVTAAGRTLHLRVALDYSARDAILRAALACRADPAPTRERFGRLLAEGTVHPPAGVGGPPHDGVQPDVDLLIRSGGERRLSDFLLWECAYAELVFSDRMWPDFGADDLRAALETFRRRERRFGGLSGAAAPGPDRSAVA